jgi:hypothetical protein
MAKPIPPPSRQPIRPGESSTASWHAAAARRGFDTTWSQHLRAMGAPLEHLAHLRSNPTCCSIQLLRAPESYYDRLQIMTSRRRTEIALRLWRAERPAKDTETVLLTSSFHKAGLLLQQLTGLDFNPPH